MKSNSIMNFVSIQSFFLLFLILNANIQEGHSLSWSNCKCGVKPTHSYVVGGRPTAPHAYPWMVAMFNGMNRQGFFCGGTLISSRHILTAAHCVHNGNTTGLDLKEFYMILGIQNLSEASKSIKVRITKSPLVSPHFKIVSQTNTPIFDIALIELDQDVPLSENVWPICLYPEQIHSEQKNFPVSWDYDDSDDDPQDTGTRVYMFHKLNRQRKRRSTINSTLSHSQSNNDIGIAPMPIISMTKMNMENNFLRADQGKMSDLIAIGWGTENPNDPNEKPSDTLKEVKIKERPLEEWCPDLYGDDSYNPLYQLCAIGFREDTCSGDSGGPLMRRRNGRFFQIGITSGGFGCGISLDPGYYTRVSAFMSWILEHTKRDHFCHL